MAFSDAKRRFFAGTAIAATVLVAGCQSGDGSGALDVGGAQKKDERVLESELRAFCPPIQLRQGTSFFNTYERKGEQDPEKIVYQASITDVTRDCSYGGNAIAVTVAVAGRIVPGPKGKAGSVTMPIRVVVVQDAGDGQDGQVVYSQLHKYPVAVTDTIGATQFVFTDPGISLPAPVSRRTVIFAGYDEGPYDTP